MKLIDAEIAKELLTNYARPTLDSEYVIPLSDALVAIDRLPSQSSESGEGWISVKDRLPEVNKIVVGWFPDGTEGGENVSSAVNYNGKYLQSNFPNSTASYFRASHWIYLPQPPTLTDH